MTNLLFRLFSVGKSEENKFIKSHTKTKDHIPVQVPTSKHGFRFGIEGSTAESAKLDMDNMTKHLVTSATTALIVYVTKVLKNST